MVVSPGNIDISPLDKCRLQLGDVLGCCPEKWDRWTADREKPIRTTVGQPKCADAHHIQTLSNMWVVLDFVT